MSKSRRKSCCELAYGFAKWRNTPTLGDPSLCCLSDRFCSECGEYDKLARGRPCDLCAPIQVRAAQNSQCCGGIALCRKHCNDYINREEYVHQHILYKIKFCNYIVCDCVLDQFKK